MNNLKQVKMGALYVDGVAQEIPFSPEFNHIPRYSKENSSIIIANHQPSRPESLITWNVVDGMERWSKNGVLLIADRVLLVNVTRKDLSINHFLRNGTVVSLKGKPYLCRLPYIGFDKSDTINEWDDVLNRTTDDNDIWHWNTVGTMGQETSSFTRGFTSPHGWYKFSGSVRTLTIGFRPALEPLDVLSKDSEHVSYPEFEAAYADLGIPYEEIKETYRQLEGAAKG